MKRRDFIKTSVGAPLLGPLELLSATQVTHLESEDIATAQFVEDKYDIQFIAVGDWGRNGEYQQIEVGKQMGEWATHHRNQFVVSTGDNIYPKGVISEHDPLWHFSFENVYTAHSLQCDWYSILGNHDYGEDPDAQIRYSSISRRWKMPARYYSMEKSLGKNKGSVLFLMLDTNHLTRDEDAEQREKQMKWLNETLENASAEVKWKIAVGHHPGFTVGPRINNYDTLSIRKVLEEVFEKHKVDVYLSGHEHSLQHLKPEDRFTHQFVSGAGSKLSDVSTGVAYSKFQASENGFMYISLNSSKLNMKVISNVGAVLYDTVISK